MKVFIFCGGKATRFNNGDPGPLKPLIRLGKKRILEYIIINLQKNNLHEIYLLGGYKIDELKKFFNGRKEYSQVKIIDTKLNTNTGGRLKMIQNLIDNGEKFILTYGDTIVNFNLKNLLETFRKDKFVISCFKKKFSYGRIIENSGRLIELREKESLIVNAGYYLFDKRIFKYINNWNESLEKNILPKIIKSNKIKFLVNFVTEWLPIDNNDDLKSVNKQIKNCKWINF